MSVYSEHWHYIGLASYWTLYSWMCWCHWQETFAVIGETISFLDITHF